MSRLGNALARLVGRAPREEPEPAEFHQLLDEAITAGQDPRRAAVTRLAANGTSIGAIARDTRLARDAVRTVLEPR